jgi:hypothetical protein
MLHNASDGDYESHSITGGYVYHDRSPRSTAWSTRNVYPVMPRL